MIRMHPCTRYLASLFLVTGCANPLDFFGVEERVIQTETQQQEDELLGNKRPDYDAALTVLENFDGCDFLLNKSRVVIRLSLQELNDKDEALDGVLFPTWTAALDRLGKRTVIPSMEVVNASLKPFMDGVYAAVELVSERGSKGSLVNKREVLDGIVAELLARYAVTPGRQSLQKAAVDFAAAQRLGGAAVALPKDLETATLDRVAAFDKDTFHSKPIGYYTWLPGLRSIYQRDRLLMHSVPQPDVISEVVDVFASRPDLQTGYGSLLRSFAGLTNPPSSYTPVDVATVDAPADGTTADDTMDGGTAGDPANGGTGDGDSTNSDSTNSNSTNSDSTNSNSTNGDAGAATVGVGAQKMAAFLGSHADYGRACGKDLRWIPPLTSPETRLFDRLACSGVGSAGNLLDSLINAIQTGKIDLTPTKQAGFFDRQLYALETLLLPDRGNESQHLVLTRAYKQKLVNTFKTVLTQTRETSAKQLFLLSPELFELKSVHMYPRFSVEPFPTFYLRTARAYAFLQSFLNAVLGADAMKNTPRVLENGQPATEPIGTELSKKIRLLYGLHILAAESIGMRPELSQDERSSISTDDAEDEAQRWLESWKKAPEVVSDPRVIEPVSRDEQQTTYRAVAGVRVLRMYATYVKGAEPEVVASLCSTRGYSPFEPYMLVEETLEVKRPSSSPPLTRDEFRAIADKTSTLDGLRDALKAAP